jgi:hypothetical protein
MTRPAPGGRSRMSDADAREWVTLSSHELTAPPARRRPRRPAGSSRLAALPGADLFPTLLLDALGGRSGIWTAQAGRPDVVVRAFRSGGHDVTALADIRRLELSEIDLVRSRAGRPGTGRAASLRAPAAGQAVAVLATGTAAVLRAGHRAVADIAAHYGYDAGDPAEQPFTLGVLGVATAGEDEKATAYVQLNGILRRIGAESAQWDPQVLARMTVEIGTRVGEQLARYRSGPVPVVGSRARARLTGRLIAEVVQDAEHAYRKRLLWERYSTRDGVADRQRSGMGRTGGERPEGGRAGRPGEHDVPDVGPAVS